MKNSDLKRYVALHHEFRREKIEIEKRLEAINAVLNGHMPRSASPARLEESPTAKPRRSMSPEARERMAEAARQRWAKAKREGRKAL